MKRYAFPVCVILFCLSFCHNAMSADTPSLLMATTTSTDNTGLLNYLGPLFTKDSGIELKWVATGTGQALKLGQNCDVDMLMVHDPESEELFMKNGYGVDRRQFMYNDFVVIGPGNDPAQVKGKSVTDALTVIRSKQIPFVSRGDSSGTHLKELALWKTAGVPIPSKETWYIQTGQGMLATINIANERSGYTLTDRGTYITYEATFKTTPPLVILVEGDASLRNQYSVIALPTDRCRNAKYDLAEKFINWLCSPAGQKLIAAYQVNGKQLFTPNAVVK